MDNGSDAESLSDYRLHRSEMQFYKERMAHAQAILGIHPTPEFAERNKEAFLHRTNHSLAKPLREFLKRKESGALRTKRDMSTIAPELREKYEKFYRDAYRANAAPAAPTIDVDDRHVVRKYNENADLYTSFYLSDLSDKLNNSMLADSESLALLGSSTTTDLLTLMHNRTFF